MAKTACILCECNCGIDVELDGRRLARIKGDKDHPASQGYTCNKAMRLDHYQNGRHRLQTPMKRMPDGTHEPIDWDTAIAEVAAELTKIPGPQILYYGGGGQGNHLGGAYATSTLKALGSRYRSSALAQEKTGEFWVDAHLYGGHTRGDFEHAEVSVFVGKNPWQSQSFPRARLVLKEIARDPARAMIVLDPVLTETAAMADIHLRVKPGTDAWCLSAVLGVLVQEDLVDHAFLAEHTTGAPAVLKTLSEIPVAAYAQHCGIDEDLIRQAARRIARADSVATFEDLGVQQGPESTLCSYLNKLTWLLTGNFAKPGAMHLHSWMQPLARYDTRERRTPVNGLPILGGLLPCNAIPEEILNDHPDRFRAMLVESANPAHSLADSKKMREALQSLDCLVVIDVAMTETARLADYVLPAASQYEKYEATFFNLEFPHNTFHLRHPLLEPLPGTLPEPEIHARLCRAIAPLDEDVLDKLRDADDFAAAFAEHAGNLNGLFSYALYETLGQRLPDPAMAALWGLAHRCFATYPDAVRRAGHADGNALFQAMIDSPSGMTFTVDDYEDAWTYVNGGTINLEIPELLTDLESLAGRRPGHTTAELPLVLSAGERRAYTANTIFRDPDWRKRDREGALRISPQDAERYGLTDGGRARVTTATGSGDALVEITDTMMPGHVSIPNGLGLDGSPGIAPNELTAASWRDSYAGTPWHKHVPAKVEPVLLLEGTGDAQLREPAVAG